MPKKAFMKLFWCILVEIILKYHFQHFLAKIANFKLGIILYFFLFTFILLIIFQKFHCNRILIGLVLPEKFRDLKKE